MMDTPMALRRIALLMVLPALVLACARYVAADEPHPFTVHDLWAIERLGDPQVSPDGRTIVLTIRSTDMAANKGLTDLWILNIDGSNLRRLTSHPTGESNPRWAPDGKSVFFLSTRSGSSQVWRIPVDGGEAVQVTCEPLDVSNLVISPDGSHIAYTMDVFVDAKGPAETKKRLDQIAEQKATGRVYDRLFFRHWDTWSDGRRSHLFVRKTSGGDAIDVTRGMDMDVPEKPFGGTEGITFTPQGKGVVFSGRNAKRDEAWSTNIDLFAVSITGEPKPTCLTESNKASDVSPVFSPDGLTLAYLAMKRPGYEADQQRVVLREWKSGKERVLSKDWPYSPGSITWAPDGRSIYITAGFLGQNALFRMDVDSGEVAPIVEQGSMGGVQTAGNRLVFLLDNLKMPAELHTVSPDGKDLKRITRVNDARLDTVRMGEYEQFTFKGWNNEDVYAYVVKPAGFVEGNKYPVAFLIHGGPQGSFGNHFHFRWNPQTYAGAGYAVVMVDFHGSTGYGQPFCDSIRGDWGGKPLEDLQKGLDAALAKYEWLDGRRVAALGASYGGYMINWIAGKWPDRFKCLVNHDGNLCERFAYFDTEELWFPEWEHGGTPWENPEGYEKHNPINHVGNWKTPMLVIHGGIDFRVVETQGMATFTALQRRGIPSKFLYFPDENHWVLKPANSVLWHETVLGWLDQWTKE